MNNIAKLLEVPVTDSEDARRRKLLNILLIGIGSITVSTLVATVVAGLIGVAGSPREVASLYSGIALALLGVGTAYVINRLWSGRIASTLFLFLVTITIVLSDTPREVVMGRSLFLFAIPIMTASVLLPPIPVLSPLRSTV